MMRYLFILLAFAFCSCKTSDCDNLSNNKVPKEKQVLIEPTIPDDVIYGKISDIPVPAGFERINYEPESFGFYLRNFDLDSDNTVYYYNGDKKYSQTYHFAVMEMDIGSRDLQQCADAVMRLRAEYLYGQKQYDKIHFNFLSDGKPRYYVDYAGNDRSYSKFRKYMDYIFSYANTASLKKEMENIPFGEMQIGDVFIQIGSPYGHSVIVVDMAQNPKTGEIIFMLAQSFMPAQSIHVLRNFNDSSISPWYSLNFGDYLSLPEWTFSSEDLHRFK